MHSFHCAASKHFRVCCAHACAEWLSFSSSCSPWPRDRPRKRRKLPTNRTSQLNIFSQHPPEVSADSAIDISDARPRVSLALSGCSVTARDAWP